MGIYVNPKNMEKEQWLNNNAEQVEVPRFALSEESDEVYLCLVDNGMFTACAVADSDREVADFARPDGRHKMWFKAKVADVNLVAS